jgi:hypothetical protein
MRLAEPDITIEVERIVWWSWLASDCIRGSIGELSRRSDDEVIETIAITHETRIDSLDDLDSLDLLSPGLLGTISLYLTTVDHSISTWLDRIIDHEFDRLDRWHHRAYRREDIIREFASEVILMKWWYYSQDEPSLTRFEERKFLEIREKILFSDTTRDRGYWFV